MRRSSRLGSTQFSFEKPLRLNDILDLRNAGKIWTFALQRASGTNSMFSISNIECEVILQEYLKINLSYIPTNLGTEMDILLFFNNPQDMKQTMSYDLIEVKLDLFDGKALKQLIGYESWFIHKKVQGDINMVRVSAIARNFDPGVIDYVQKRKLYEGKEIKLLRYNLVPDTGLELKRVGISE
jgi:hypothetical protein